MQIKVRMIAFMNGEIRTVTIPDTDFPDNRLDLAFKYGQNDFQPQQMPSVSVGDVIELDQRLYQVKSVGFEEINEQEYQYFLALPRRDRLFWNFFGGCNP